ncbi:radical SAM family heme chaperone HemW [Flavobacterium branchiophilum]|uniref:Heme chaperone HemW n=1 Tax=Flavobacterium branchiophilum (strain FL-15) TaxID=1034807 RepID=G2Z4E9_FLABF|nr:radical SAM family heme chaperone HemW [Flavobacterium branchiophilum]CCB68424.1 Probable coproporphyrinogen oxidase [Flavobacterium branchiophilum FL-15]
MSGIYLHIPFCKQACHYCDFHFSTVLKHQSNWVTALGRELELRKNEFQNTAVSTIYFGGGTPSLLTIKELEYILDQIKKQYEVVPQPEITLEANPDDLTAEKLKQYLHLGINRLSIGVQSFFDDDLTMMNRAHSASEALKGLQLATQYFDNISIDLIYGIPNMSAQKWLHNIQTAIHLGIPHISSYALTVEPKTMLHHLIQKAVLPPLNDELASDHFQILVEQLTQNGFIHYELSNFGKPNYFSQNNSAYWLGKKYLGFGPSAHSFDGTSRSWNVSNNNLYIKSLEQNKLPSEIEALSITDLYNEYIMTGLRTIWGVDFIEVERKFGKQMLAYLQKRALKFIQNQLLVIENNVLKTTTKGKFLCDGIASDLFKIN